jgi:drug/metabolite transporter (DMT)-like permease
VPGPVLAAVLLGALLHATWNAMVKSGADKLLDLVLVASATGAVGAVVLAVAGAPAPASWPYAALSAAIHALYFPLVALAYAAGDMSTAYPTMRGTAPVIVALGSAAVFGERLGPLAWAGVLLISGGVLGLALAGRDPTRRRGAPPGFALANAVVIAAYTCVDGLGVRLSGNAPAYTASVFLLDVPPLVAIAVWRRSRARVFAHVAARWRWGLGGGLATAASYGLSLWAMTRAPVAAVAALRETSILFGVALAALVLGERFGPARCAAAASVVAGAIALRLA